MRNVSKKIISLVAAATLLGTTFAMTSCGGKSYKGDTLDVTITDAAAVSNGGFAVEKDDYVYFVNGAEDYTASNKYGDVTKGALMRVKKSDLGKVGAETDVVVPLLFVSQSTESGIFIYGDRVYFATPTTDKNLSGEVENSWIDFKSAKLDGSEVMKDYYFRLKNNATNYRFVEVDDVVYCMYEEDGALKSYNVETGKTNVLVKGAKSTFFFDKNDATNPNVYYTMGVEYDMDSENPSSPDYDQLYCVNAAATAKANASEASYTTSNGKTYDFDKEFLQESEKDCDFNDYATYPYVNLGELVLDGVGLNNVNLNGMSQFNEDKESSPATPDGYQYTISSHQNGGVYFTRAEVTKTASDAENTKLYYVATEDVAADEWNAIDGNGSDSVDVVALDTTNASASAVFYITEEGAHEYLYLSSDILYRAGQPVNGVEETVALAYKLSGATLWKIDGDYLYYQATGTNGNSLSRINYTGDEDKYNPLLVEDEYKPLTLAYVDWNSSWYKPEIIGDTVLYSNAQSFGSVAYNYIYTAKLGTTADLIAANELYEDIQEEIGEANIDAQAVMNYVFRTGKTDAYEAVKDLYDEDQIEEIEEFLAKEYKESNFINMLGKLADDDAEAIENAWVDSLLSEDVVEEEKGLATWAICLIVAGGVIIVAAAVLIPLLISMKKKQAKKAEDDAIVNAAKRKKIDTTDDKTIDVYADETAEETPVEEAVAEEAVEEVVEETPVEEVAEPVVEEAPAEEVAPVVEEAPAEEVAEPAEEEKKDE